MENISKNEALMIVRKELGLTQEKFAREIKVTPPYISSIESGTRVPSDTILELLIYKFSVNREWLESGEGEIFTEKPPKTLQKSLSKKEAIERDLTGVAIGLAAFVPLLSAGLAVGVGASIIVERMCKVSGAKNANELAKKHLHIERSTITNWIKKNRIPRKYIDKISEAAGLKQSTLVYDSVPLLIDRNTLLQIGSYILKKHGIPKVDLEKLDQDISESLQRVGCTEIAGN